jgi:hypothetical protein
LGILGFSLFFSWWKKKKNKVRFFYYWPFSYHERGFWESGKRESCLLKNFFFSFSLETKRRAHWVPSKKKKTN